MNKILILIKEELKRFLKEDSDDKIYDLYEKRDNIQSNILYDFLYNNNSTFTKRIGWKLVPAPRLKKIWEDYIRTTLIRDEKGIDYISSIMITNVLKLDILTTLAGHTSTNSDEYFEEAWDDYIDKYIDNLNININRTNDLNESLNLNQQNVLFDNFIDNQGDLEDIDLKEKLMEILLEHFYDYYSRDKNGTLIISDFGLKPLLNLVVQLIKEEDNYQNKLIIIDKMLNIAHQRSDLASWFIEGGSTSLSNISGYYSNTDYPWDSSSVISGKYRMNDYQ